MVKNKNKSFDNDNSTPNKSAQDDDSAFVTENNDMITLHFPIAPPKKLLALVLEDFAQVANDPLRSFQHIVKVWERGAVITDNDLILALFKEDSPIEVYQQYELDKSTESGH